MANIPGSVSLQEKVAAFCVASVRDWTGAAVRMLAETPEIAGYGLATALLLGDVARVRGEIEAGRADGLLATARLLLDAGADPNAPLGPGGRAPLQCAAAAASSGVSNADVMRLLIERGAVVTEDDFYLSAFSSDGYRCLRVLLSQAPAVAKDAGKALAAPVSTRDVEGVRLLLDGGVDPRRYADDEGRPMSAVYAAVQAGCPAEVIVLLIEHGADPALPGPDGHTAAWLAAVRGRADLDRLLGTRDGVTDSARFAGACLRGDRGTAGGFVTAAPGLVGRLEDDELAVLVLAAEAGDEAAVALMLDLGFPVGVRRPEDGATALHAAAYAGSAPVVRLLLDRGADLATPDGQWQGTPLDWAAVGSGYRPETAPRPDWGATVRLLVEAGASTAGISLSSDDPKPPSPAVADLLRSYGAGRLAGGPVASPGSGILAGCRARTCHTLGLMTGPRLTGLGTTSPQGVPICLWPAPTRQPRPTGDVLSALSVMV
jgi:ankyrin repeat protein